MPFCHVFRDHAALPEPKASLPIDDYQAGRFQRWSRRVRRKKWNVRRKKWNQFFWDHFFNEIQLKMNFGRTKPVPLFVPFFQRKKVERRTEKVERHSEKNGTTHGKSGTPHGKMERRKEKWNVKRKKWNDARTKMARHHRKIERHTEVLRERRHQWCDAPITRAIQDSENRGSTPLWSASFSLLLHNS